jgi:hypothetical protein
MIFVMKFQAAAMSRSNIPENQRVDFSLYVDEFQNFSTDSFATIMSEARKYHLNLIVANQFTTQLTPEVRDAVFGNMGTIVSFRIGQNDVEAITKYFQPIFDSDDLLRVPNYNTIVRTLIGGVPTQPFSMATLPALGTPNPRLSDALKQLSAAKYGRPQSTVEKEIFERMTVKPDPNVSPAASAFNSPFGGATGTAASPNPWQAPTRISAAPAPTGSGSFLDEWLSKRTAAPQAPIAASTSVMPAPTSASNAAGSGPLGNLPPNPFQSPPAKPTSPVQQTAAPTSINTKNDGPTSATTPNVESTPNISSEELENKEVDRIAAELKQQLGADKPEEAAKKPEPVTKKPDEKPAEPSVDKPSVASGDTIFIDREGNLHTAEEQ